MRGSHAGGDATVRPGRPDPDRGRRPLRRTVAVLAVAALLGACTTGTSDGPAGGAAADAAEGTRIAVAATEPGPRLVDGDGRTLYLFTDDSPGVSTCVDGCLAVWPAVLTTGAPVALAGVDASLLGTLTRADGGVQVTYAGWPLYLYAADTRAGDVAGQGVGGVWFVVAPDGTALGAPGAADTDEDGSETPPPSSGYSY